MSIMEFLNMGGYGFYVWTSYGLWTVVMILNIYLSRLRENEVRHRIKSRINQ